MSESYGAAMANASAVASTLPLTTIPNYWPDFGPLQYIEVIYLTIITVLGTIGNFIVIFSIALERRVHMHGNIFIINLAVADLIVSAIIVPTTIANVVRTENALPPVFCSIIGFMVTATCTCSLCNLMFIAVNRYWAVVRPSTYQKMFSRKRVLYMVLFTWIWSALLVMPTLAGWGGLKYDRKMMVCSWDDEKHKSYTFFLAAVAIFLPMLVIAVAYFKLFSTVRGSGRWVRSLSVGSGLSANSDQHRRSMLKERSLLRTLLTTVVLFCICWLPFGACIIINPSGTPAHAKKVFGWLALTNSCVNFIIYGAMNPVFRRGYHNLFVFVFRCKRAQQLSSAMLHGSFSDSYRKTKQQSKGGVMNNMSDANKESSRMDTGVLKEFVMSIRRTALMRESGQRRNSAGNTATPKNLQMNGAEVNQVQTLGNDNSSGSKHISHVMHQQPSRRSLSDVLPVPGITGEKHHGNGDCNNFSILDVGEVASSNSLRERWMPDKTVYTSKRATTFVQASPTNVTSEETGSADGSPTRKLIVTVSSDVDQKSKEIVTENGDSDLAPEVVPASFALHEMSHAHEERNLQGEIYETDYLADNTTPTNGQLFSPEEIFATDVLQAFPPPPEEV